jgi:tRNA A37 N6-isopentenylltransferase MiaA
MAEAGARINASVKDSIGVRELMEHLQGKTTVEEAENKIGTRTRQLAWRQIKWFDKLARGLKGRVDIRMAESRANLDLLNYMHERIGA